VRRCGSADLTPAEVDAHSDDNDSWYWEPVAAWRKLSSEARGILDLAANVHMNELDGKHGTTLDDQRGYLANRVNGWLSSGEVRPYLEGRGRVLRVSIGGENMFGALATQLLAAVTRTRALALCSSCGKPYSPRRRAARGRRGFCSRCGLKAAWREAQRNLRTLKAEARRLRTDGESIDSIAKVIGRDRKQVRAWLEKLRTKRSAKASRAGGRRE